MRVRAADGRPWRIGRRWLPWRPRVHRFRDSTWGLPSGDEAVILVVLAVALAVMAVAVEWLLLLLVLPVATLLRLASGWPWTVVAASGPGARYVARARGWRASRDLVEAARVEIETHGTPRSLTPIS